ncbi:hypothetical protein MNV49_007992 [Pseudohyphozyma bogoriensis]|nr:hypothetical protein MNV49_007992 [Pseudohyphozyma bogoriensis]
MAAPTLDDLGVDEPSLRMEWLSVFLFPLGRSMSAAPGNAVCLTRSLCASFSCWAFVGFEVEVVALGVEWGRVADTYFDDDNFAAVSTFLYFAVRVPRANFSALLFCRSSSTCPFLDTLPHIIKTHRVTSDTSTCRWLPGMPAGTDGGAVGTSARLGRPRAGRKLKHRSSHRRTSFECHTECIYSHEFEPVVKSGAREEQGLS